MLEFSLIVKDATAPDGQPRVRGVLTFFARNRTECVILWGENVSDVMSQAIEHLNGK